MSITTSDDAPTQTAMDTSFEMMWSSAQAPDYFNRPMPSVEPPWQQQTTFPPTPGTIMKAHGVIDASMPSYNVTPQRQYASHVSLSYNPNIPASLPTPITPFVNHDRLALGSNYPPALSQHSASPAPSFGGDSSLFGSDQQKPSPHSPALTVLHNDVKQESTSRQEQSNTGTTPKRKRGRPKVIRDDTMSSMSTNSTNGSDQQPHSPNSVQTRGRISKRLPHNQVERKYREGLNSELERLRRAVPTLPQPRDTQDLSGPPKPSKATVLASAIDYIKYLEEEQQRLTAENEALQDGKGTASAARKDSRIGWMRHRSASNSTLGDAS